MAVVVDKESMRKELLDDPREELTKLAAVVDIQALVAADEGAVEPIIVVFEDERGLPFELFLLRPESRLLLFSLEGFRSNR